MQVIVIPMTEPVKNRFKEMMKHAAENVVTLEQLEKTKHGEGNPIGNDPAFACHEYANCKIVYSHEMQQEPMNECKHLSVSYLTEADIEILKATGDAVNIDTLPPPELVQMIMMEFGFQMPLSNSIVWKERVGANLEAINVLEPLDIDHVIKETNKSRKE